MSDSSSFVSSAASPHGVTPTLSMHPPIAHAEHQQASTRISGMERRPGTSTTACMPSRVFSWFVVDSNSKVSQKDHLLDLLEEPDEVYGVCGTSFSESYVDNSHYCSIIRDNSTSFKGCGFSCTTYRAPLRCAEPPSSDLTTTSDLGDVPKSTSSRKSKNHQQQFLDEG